MVSPLLIAFLGASRLDGELTGHISRTGHLGRFLLHRFLFFLRAHRPLECHFPVLGNDLHVMGVGRERGVVHQGLAYFLHDVAVGLVVLTLVGCWLSGRTIPLIDFGVIGRRRLFLLSLHVA